MDVIMGVDGRSKETDTSDKWNSIKTKQQHSANVEKLIE